MLCYVMLCSELSVSVSKSCLVNLEKKLHKTHMLHALEGEIDRFAKHFVKVLTLPTPTSYHLRPAKSS